MSRYDLWIIEARNADGSLCFDCPQPPVEAMTEDAMAQRVFRVKPDAIMSGTDIPLWPRYIHPKWIARRKAW